MYSQFRLEALADARVRLELDKIYFEQGNLDSVEIDTLERQITYLDEQIEITKRNAPIEAAETGGNLMRSMMRAIDEDGLGED